MTDSTPVAAVVALISAVNLLGCANTTPPIAFSSKEDASKVRFVNKADSAWIDLYPQNECNNGVNVIHDNAIGNAIRAASEGAPRRVGMLDAVDPADRTIAEFAFIPGQRVNVGIGGAIGRSCLGGVSFTVRSAVQYEVILTNASGRCSLTVSTLEAQPRGALRRPLQELGPLVCKSARS
jgi:hypothetical protein